jgi:uncharacterized protein
MLLKTRNKNVAENERELPIPTQLVSNGEYWPIPQTRRQRKIEELTLSMADERAHKLGVSRRSFLRSAAGTATALMALNIANGCGDDDGGGFAVDDCATRDPAAARESLQADYFIVDVQTHHADLEGPVGSVPVLGDFYRNFRICYPGMDLAGCTRGELSELSRLNYIKEVLIDSETSVAMMSGLPAPNSSLELIGNDAMAATRDLGNELGASQRMLTQAMLTPNLEVADTRTTVADMEYLVNVLGIRALKTYTGAGHRGEDQATAVWGDTRPWWLDDENVAYPMYEEALRLGVNIVNSHKGLRLGVFDREYIKPRDIPKAVLDWPQINFAIYHSAGEFLDELVEIKRNLDTTPGFANNLYAELGAIFASNVISGEIDQIGHLLGKLVNAFGPQRILWGTDSIWYGTPQWQIDALKTFQMPRRLRDDFGYPEITEDIKARIFGLNAADLYGLDAGEIRCTIAEDPIATVQASYDREAYRSLRTYGPKTRREFIQMNYSGKGPHV